MFSFKKEEPKHKCSSTVKSSVLEDYPAVDRRREWPFEWDWNGLCCHDLPLLDLPDNVLIDVLQMLTRDDRWNLSLSCHKLRRLILDEEMDRRPTLDTVEINLNESEVRVVDEDEDFGYQNKFEFEDLPSFEKVIKNAVSPWYYQEANVTIDRLPNCLLGIPNSIEYFVNLVAGWTDRITLCGPKQPSGDIVKQMVDVFVKDPDFVQQVAFGDPDKRDTVPERWEEYCTTVTEWANARGTKVRRVVAEDVILQIKNWGFGLTDDYHRNGDMYWVVEIIDFVNGKPDESMDDEDSDEDSEEESSKMRKMKKKMKKMKEKMVTMKAKMKSMTTSEVKADSGKLKRMNQTSAVQPVRSNKRKYRFFDDSDDEGMEAESGDVKKTKKMQVKNAESDEDSEFEDDDDEDDFVSADDYDDDDSESDDEEDSESDDDEE